MKKETKSVCINLYQHPTPKESTALCCLTQPNAKLLEIVILDHAKVILKNRRVWEILVLQQMLKNQRVNYRCGRLLGSVQKKIGDEQNVWEMF
jgi:hypothetical protein